MATTFDLTGQVVLVTGASGALGTATAERFHDAGAIVCMSARNPPNSDDGPSLDDERVHFYPADFTVEDEVSRTFESILDDHGQLDALCALIGAWRGGSSIDETPIESFEFVMDVNLRTLFLAAKHAIPHLQETGGSIVGVSAKSAREGGTGDGPYRAAKAGVRRLIESIAKEQRGTVSANAIMPSIIDTPANREMLPGAEHERWPTPDEIADVLLFLCSDAGTVTTGGTIPVFGEADGS